MGISQPDLHTLTPEKKELLARIIDDWSRETFFRGPEIDEDVLTEGIQWLYRSGRFTRPDIKVLDSPIECQCELHAIEKRSGTAIRVDVQVWPDRDFRMWSHLWWQVMGEFLKYKQSDILSNVGEGLINLTVREAAESCGRYFEFSEDSLLTRYRRAAYYDFLERFGIVTKEELRRYISFLRAGCFLSIFVQGHALISRRPVSLKYNSQGRFHNENGPAISWKSGEPYYFLNGVRVRREIVDCPPEHLDVKMFLMERNLDVRREIVRRVGIDILLNRLGGKVIDRWQEYELVQLNVPDMRIKPTYLKMRNPSIGTFHVEGVPPDITSCKAALSWRVGGLNWDPEQLT